MQKKPQAWFSRVHKHKQMCKQVKTGSTEAQAQGRGPIIGHPDLMLTYQKHYGGRFVHHLVYHWVEERWYRELSQICHCACAHVLILMR